MKMNISVMITAWNQIHTPVECALKPRDPLCYVMTFSHQLIEVPI